MWIILMANGITVVLSNGGVLKFDTSSTEISFAGISSLTDADIIQLVKGLKEVPNIIKLVVPDKILGGGRAVFNLLCENHTITEIECYKELKSDGVYGDRVKELIRRNKLIHNATNCKDSVQIQIDAIVEDKTKYVEQERRNLKALDSCTHSILKLIFLGVIADLYNVYRGKEIKSLIHGHSASVGLYSVANAAICGFLAAAPSLFANRKLIEHGGFFFMMQGGAVAYCITTFFSTYVHKIEPPYVKCAVTLLSAAVMSAYLIRSNKDVGTGIA